VILTLLSSSRKKKVKSIIIYCQSSFTIEISFNQETTNTNKQTKNKIIIKTKNQRKMNEFKINLKFKDLTIKNI
jgi:hypothetical protein